jgi:hypothetical protein
MSLENILLALMIIIMIISICILMKLIAYKLRRSDNDEHVETETPQQPTQPHIIPQPVIPPTQPPRVQIQYGVREGLRRIGNHVARTIRVQWRLFPPQPTVLMTRRKKKHRSVDPNAPKTVKTQVAYENLEDHNDDSQNAHDPFIVKSLAKKYNRLVELTKDSNELLGGMFSEEELQQA